MLLTIAIPTWNRPKYLEELLASINRNLDSEHFAKYIEVIICDNCSSCDIKTITSNFKLKSHLHIEYHRHNENIGGNRNIAYSANVGSGEYVWVLGDDDLLVPSALAEIVTMLNELPDFVILNHSVYNHDFNFIRVKKWFNISNNVTIVNRNAAMSYLGATPSFISAVIAKRKILNSLTEAELSRHVEYGFNQLFAFYNKLPFRVNGCVTANVLVLARSDKGSVQYDWVKYFVEGLGKLFSELKLSGLYTNKAICDAKGSVVLKYHIWRLMNEKSEKRDVNKLKNLVQTNFGETWQFRFIFYPLSIIPSEFYFLVKKIKISFRKYKGVLCEK